MEPSLPEQSPNEPGGEPAATPTPSTFGAPSPYVAEIKARLADIARRETALKLREAELEQQYRLMQQFVRDEAERELNEARARLAARSAEMDGQTIELLQRRSELDRRADDLAEAQRQVEDQRRALADAERALDAARSDFSSTAQRDGDERERDRRSLLSRIEIIRRHEQDLERRTTRARDEIVRQRATLSEQQTAQQREAAALAARRAEVEAELRTLRMRHDEDFRRQRGDLAADLQREREELAATAQRQLAEGAATLARQRKEAAAELQQRQAVVAEELRRQRADVAAELQREREQLDIDLRDRRAELAALNAEYDERSGKLEAAAEEVRAERAAAEAALAAGQAAREDVDARRAALAREDAALSAARAGLDAQQKELEKFHQTAAQQRQKLLREVEAYRARRTQLAAEITAADTRTAALDQRDAQLRQRSDELRAEAERVAARTAELTRQHRAAEAELDKRRRQAEAEIEKRRQTVEAGLQQKRAAAQQEIDTWRDGIEAQLSARQARLDERDANTAVLEEDLLRLRDETAMLRDQAEARDAETRQTALAAELDRQQVERERGLLEAAHAEVMLTREQRDADLLAIRATLRERAERLRLAERARFATPKWWWLRATLLAGAAAAGAAMLWLRWEVPAYRTDVRLGVQSASSDAALVAGQHAAALLATVPQAADGGTGEALRTALAEGRIAVRPVPAESAVVLSVSDGNADRSRLLAVAVAESYAASVNAVAPTQQLPSAYVDLTTRRERVEADLRPLHGARAEWVALLASLPPPDERERLLNESLALREQQRAAATELLKRREEQAALLRGADPRGAVDEAAYAAACAADDVLREDLTEFSRSAARYQVELSAAMSEPATALAEYKAALDTYAAAIGGQSAEQPTPDASAVLEEAAADVEERQSQVAAFDAAWRARQSAVSGLVPDADIVKLIEQQAAAADAARTFSEGGRVFLAGQDGRLRSLAEVTDGGTRAAVLANALRGGLAKVGDAQRAVDQAVARVDLRGNVDLDALDRLLRGLRTHITQRQEMIQQDLQVEADRRARSNYETHLVEVREAVESLEAQRERALTELTMTLDAMRGMENVVLERRRLEDRIAFADASIAQLEQQREQLDGMLAEARRSGPAPDRVSVVGAPKGTQVAGARRERNAALAGLVAFGAIGLACTLMLLRNPLARRRADAAGDLDALFSGVPARAESS